MKSIKVAALIGVLAVTATVLFGMHAVRADGKKIIVNELKATGVDADTAATLGELLCSHLAGKAKGYSVMCANDVKTILQSKNNEVLMGGCENEKCLAQIGTLLDANLVLSGSIGAVGKKFIISLSIVDVGKSATIARSSQTADSPEGLIDAIAKAADDLWKQLGSSK